MVVTYQSIHADCVHDIFKAITAYLEVQLHIAISDTFNLPQQKCMDRLYFREKLVGDVLQAQLGASHLM